MQLQDNAVLITGAIYGRTTGIRRAIAAVFLASDASSYSRGAEAAVNGDWATL